MKLETGKYHGTELGDVPTDYLEWAISHLTMDDQAQAEVVAEVARRTNAQKVEAETPIQRLTERVSETVTKFAAKHGH